MMRGIDPPCRLGQVGQARLTLSQARQIPPPQIARTFGFMRKTAAHGDKDRAAIEGKRLFIWIKHLQQKPLHAAGGGLGQRPL